MKIGLLMGILLVLTLVSPYVAPQTQAQEPVLVTHTVTIVGGEPEPEVRGIEFDKLTQIGKPERSITAMWQGGSPVVYARWSGPWPIMTIHAWSFWLCPQSVKIGLRPSQHLYGFPIPNDYLGFLQPLFLNLQVWFESEGILPKRPASYYLEPWELPPMPPTDEEMSHWPSPELMSTDSHTVTIGVNALPVWPGRELATPQLYKGWNDLETLPGNLPQPRPEPESGFYKLTPAPESVDWDTHTVTIAIMRAGPFNGWWVVGDTITVTLPGPKPESEMFCAMTPGPEPVMVIHTLSVWTATERAKLRTNQSWGLEMYPGIPERLMPSDYPPMPPSDEFVSQLLATTPSTPLSEPAPTWGQTITDTTSNGWSSLTYEP